MAAVSGGQLEAEGFLCPLCMKDLVSPAQLEQHWKKSHPQEDNDVLRQLKGLFGKARKFLRIDEDGSTESSPSLLSDVSSAPADGHGAVVTAHLEPQELGQTRQHNDYFREARSRRNDRFVMETNKLIVRLDKLLAILVAPSDVAKRKAAEQKIVPWALDEDFRLCMTCGHKLGIVGGRRRHHCRLCGGIMCDKCSHFLQHSFARQLTETHIVSADSEREKEARSVAVTVGSAGFLRRRGSDSSLSSYATDEGGFHIRTCTECRRMLEQRHEQNHHRQHKELIVEYYEKMQEWMQVASKLVPEFKKMAESLLSGESTYSLDAANTARSRITRLYEQVDTVSKKILHLDTDNSEDLPSQRRLALQKSIRDCAVGHLRAHAYTLPHVPSADEYASKRAARDASKRAARDADVKRRLDAELKAAAVPAAISSGSKNAEAATTRGHSGGPNARFDARQVPFTKGDVVTGSSGNRSQATSPKKLSPVAELHFTEGTTYRQSDALDDPLLMQIRRVKSYLVKAETDQNWDEVQMLQGNLSMLEKQMAAMRATAS